MNCNNNECSQALLTEWEYCPYCGFETTVTNIDSATDVPPEKIMESAQLLENTLEEFEIDAHITGVEVTNNQMGFEILPGQGTRVEEIVELTNNIALRMHAQEIQILPVNPGKGVCKILIS